MTRFLAVCLVALAAMAPSLHAADKKIVFVAGKPSHGSGEHEHNAGSLLLKKCLDQLPGIKTDIHLNGWPEDESFFDGADTIVLYMDGGANHPILQGDRLRRMEARMKKGVGLALIHYAVEPTREKGQREFLDWIGGAFEIHWSVNPHWEANFTKLPDHPITRGVKPFKLQDEWYFNMRFRDGLEGVTPILSAVPPAHTMSRQDGPHSGNPDVREAVKRGDLQHVAWAYERPGGGRGFGFTGAHFHNNWSNDNFRKTMLNAILWTANIEVPKNGVESKITPENLEENLDPKGRKKNAATTPPEGPMPAARALKYLDPADGLEVTLFAGEPMLRNPANIDIDDRGRVWVAEAANYRSSFQLWGVLDPKGDRIVILEDTDGDGAADQSKVFYQDPSLQAPLGICVLGRKVIVSASPEVFVLTDTDGDDKADQKEVLFRVEGFDDDHGVHAMTFGPDGKLYFNFGNHGNALMRADGSPVVDIHGNEVSSRNGIYRQGMTFRCNLDGSDVEVLGHNFRNPYEVAVDSFGTIWQSDNDDDGNRAVRINYVMPGGNYGYTDEKTGASWLQKRTNLENTIPEQHWHQNDPGVVPNLLVTGAGAPCGIVVYEGTLLPEPFRNQMILCDAGPGVVRSHPVTVNGAGYSATTIDLLRGRDPWFRPSDICVAPDGSLYVADWYDAGVGGHNMADRVAGELRGRIYRVAPKGHRPVVPFHDMTRISGAVAALQSPNAAVRYQAWDQLLHLGRHAEADLQRLWRNGEPRMRARALHLLARIEGKGEQYLRQARQDASPDIRIAALRIGRDIGQDMIPVIREMVSDASPQVRRECALLLREFDSAEAATLWAELAVQHDGRDRWYLEALGIGARKHESACFKAWLSKAGGQWNTPAGRDIIWRSRAPEAAPCLAKLIMDPATSDRERARYFRAFDFIEGEEKETALLGLLSAVTQQVFN